MFEIQRATKTKSKATVLLNGASGSGKSYSALLLALGMKAELEELEQRPIKIGGIDTENNALSDYVHLYPELDVINLDAPFTVDRYLGAFDAFVDAGYDIVIVDSLTHAWKGAGGIMEQVDARQSTEKNKFGAWKEPSLEYARLLDRMILKSPVHLIGTSRAKQAYEIGDDKKPVKVGLQSELRDGTEYEFRMSLMIGMDHFASVSVGKDRTGTFEKAHRITPDDGRAIIRWFNDGASVPPTLDATRAQLNAAVKERGWPGSVVVGLINNLGGDTRLETLPAARRQDLIDATAGMYPANDAAPAAKGA